MTGNNVGPATAGWYPDPSGAPGQRYFDGQRWTDAHRATAGHRKITSVQLAALAILAIAFIGVCILGITSRSRPAAPAAPAAPTSTPTAADVDKKFLADLDAQFDDELNHGKSVFSDPMHYLTLSDTNIATGHEICTYLGSHSDGDIDSVVEHFRLSMPTAPPTHSDTKEFVGIAVKDLCPQYASSPALAPAPTPVAQPGPLSSLATIAVPVGSTLVQSGPQSSGDIHLTQEVWHYVTSFDTAVATIQSQVTNRQITTPDGVTQNPCPQPGDDVNAENHRTQLDDAYDWFLSTGGETVEITVYRATPPSSTSDPNIVPDGARIDIVYEIGTCDS
jgi:hypothetical protein